MDTIKINHVHTSAEKIQIAHLLYEKDGSFVPVTPLATLNTSTTFFKATLNDEGAIRAATSFEEWLPGCDQSKTLDCTVYELSSSIVRSPMGGLKGPSLHQVFAFVRLLTIVTPFLLADEVDESAICVMAAIAAQNGKSFGGMQAIGMAPVDPWPKWLTYEHRAWFPKLEADRPLEEAHYLWFNGSNAKDFLRTILPVVTGGQPLRRPADGAEFAVEMNVGELEHLRLQFGSLAAAIDNIPERLFVPPPEHARLMHENDGAPRDYLIF